MKQKLLRACPSYEVLTLIFGILASGAINLLTSLATGGLSTSGETRASWADALLLGSTLTSGALLVVVGRIRSDALERLGGSLTEGERRAQLRMRMEQSASTIISLQLATVGTFAAGMMALFVTG
jgi:hypothetical protein